MKHDNSEVKDFAEISKVVLPEKPVYCQKKEAHQLAWKRMQPRMMGAILAVVGVKWYQHLVGDAMGGGNC